MSATRLHLAAFDGDNDAVNQLLSEKADVNARTDYNETPLLFAAMNGHTVTVRTLLKWGADPNILPVESSSPLQRAVVAGHAEVVQLLLAKGADPEAVAPQKIRTPEEIAKIKEDRRELFNKINRGQDSPTDADPPTDEEIEETIAPPPVPGSRKLRLLQSAVHSGSTATLKALLEAGYSPVPPPGYKSYGSLLNVACTRPNKREIASLLIQHGMSVDGDGSDNTPPLANAILFGDVDFARYLLEAGARTDSVTAGIGMSLLSFAVIRENRAMIELLIENNVGVEDRLVTTFAKEKDRPYIQELLDKKRQTHWFTYVESGDTEKVAEALRNGVDINFADGNVGSALQIAVDKGDIPMVRLLLEAGANVRKRDRHDATPLHTAAAKGIVQAINLLVQYGADVSEESTFGYTPLHRAAQKKQQSAADALMAHGASLSVVEAVLLQRMDLVRDFWSRGTPIDYANETGMTALHAAVFLEDKELVASLLDNGADIHRRSKVKHTPLKTAIILDNVEITQLLLDRGADITGSNGPHSFVDTAITNRNEKMLRLLLERGASMDAPNLEEMKSRLSKKKLLSSDIQSILEKHNPLSRLLSMYRYAMDEHSVNPDHFWTLPEPLWPIIRTVLEFGANANTVDDRNRSLLVNLIEFGAPVDLVQYAIDKGATVNEEERSFNIPLMTAIINERADVVSILLKAGANPDGGRVKESPIELAQETGQSEIVSLLEQYGASNEKRQAFVDSLGEMAQFLSSAKESKKWTMANMPMFDFDAQRTHMQNHRSKQIMDRRKMLEEEVHLAEGISR